MSLNKITQLSTKNKITLWVAIFIAICLGFIFTAIIPTVKSIIEIRNKIINAKIDTRQRLTQNSAANKINDKLIKIEPQIDKLNQSFINKNREIEFITTLEDIAAKNYVTQKFNLGSSAAIESGLSKNSIDISAQGTYANILNYLKDIEKLNYYINISSLDISKQETNIINTGSGQNDISIRLSGFTYWK